uniref:Uncharacterized protein n=1 Tax=Brassica oleracea TaxID=3712 RepID=A0A3P6E925_BRAOL|nr:unnamed protein product [Brassica oleracea]
MTIITIITSVAVVAAVVAKVVPSMFLIRSHIQQQVLVMTQMVMGFSRCQYLRLMSTKITQFGMVYGIWMWKDKEALVEVLVSQGSTVSRTCLFPSVSLSL